MCHQVDDPPEALVGRLVFGQGRSLGAERHRVNDAADERAGRHRPRRRLRHSFASDALALGVPDTQVAELLGHSGTAMLHRHYAHLAARARALRDALKRVRTPWGTSA